MQTIRRVPLSVLLASGIFLFATSLFTSAADGQQGYYAPQGYYRGYNSGYAEGYRDAYRPYSYRDMGRNGKYHGYWRDLGYGFSGRGSRGYYIPPVNYYGGYAPAYPNYYAPPPQPYGYR